MTKDMDRLLELKLKREESEDSFTLGAIKIDDQLFCYTVEDVERDLKDLNGDGDFNDKGEGKVYGETAIKKGRYRVIVTWSPKYKRLMPLLVNVEGFEGIRIHSGNKAEDSHGCIIIGLTRTKNGVGRSRDACRALMKILKGRRMVVIEIT